MATDSSARDAVSPSDGDGEDAQADAWVRCNTCDWELSDDIDNAIILLTEHRTFEHSPAPAEGTAVEARTFDFGKLYDCHTCGGREISSSAAHPGKHWRMDEMTHVEHLCGPLTLPAPPVSPSDGDGEGRLLDLIPSTLAGAEPWMQFLIDIGLTEEPLDADLEAVERFEMAVRADERSKARSEGDQALREAEARAERFYTQAWQLREREAAAEFDNATLRAELDRLRAQLREQDEAQAWQDESCWAGLPSSRCNERRGHTIHDGACYGCDSDVPHSHHGFIPKETTAEYWATYALTPPTSDSLEGPNDAD